MRSATGDGYTLTVLTGEDEYYFKGGGTFIVESGRWTVEDMDFTAEESGVSTRDETYIRGLNDEGEGALGFLQVVDGIYRAHTDIVSKPWGCEIIVVPTLGLLKVITVEAGKRTSLQSHTVKDEIIMPLRGEGGVSIGGSPYTDDEPLNIRPKTKHRTVGPVTFIEGSTYHPHDVIRHEDDFGRET